MASSTDVEGDYTKHIESLLTDNTGAFISEMMQSCAGQIIPPKGLYKAVYQKLQERGVVCIAD